MVDITIFSGFAGFGSKPQQRRKKHSLRLREQHMHKGASEECINTAKKEVGCQLKYLG